MSQRCPQCPVPEGLECPAIARPHPKYCELMALKPRTWGPEIVRTARRDAVMPAPHAESGACVYLGAQAFDEHGRQLTRACTSCRGHVLQKLFSCHHPGHASDPMTTVRECEQCPDRRTPSPGGLPVEMVIPSRKRPGIWRDGILQIMVTRACDLSCHHCTQGSNLAGRPAMMTVDQFDEACASLEGYFGVVGMFGGNPAMHPKFDELCKVMRARFPFDQRGLWCNNLRGKGAHARVTFNPKHSNINVHLDGAAAEEFRRDWPESAPYIKGTDTDSVHGSPWVAMKDVVPDEAERWRLIGDCDVNKHWSAAIGVVRGELRAFFCELAYAQAALHENNPDWDGTGAPMPDTGLKVEPGWWRRPLADFEAQVRTHCHSCGIPLRRKGQLAIGGEKEEFSKTHESIARPKVRGRAVEVIESIGRIERPERPSTEYLPGTTPRVRV